jgi:hypothetical protein
VTPITTAIATETAKLEAPLTWGLKPVAGPARKRPRIIGENYGTERALQSKKGVPFKCSTRFAQ